MEVEVVQCLRLSDRDAESKKTQEQRIQDQKEFLEKALAKL